MRSSGSACASRSRCQAAALPCRRAHNRRASRRCHCRERSRQRSGLASPGASPCICAQATASSAIAQGNLAAGLIDTPAGANLGLDDQGIDRAIVKGQVPAPRGAVQSRWSRSHVHRDETSPT